MILMYQNTPVLQYDLEKSICIQVLNNNLLPFALRDYIKDIEPDSGLFNTEELMSTVFALRDFLSCRVLNLSRENAKAILKTAAFPQSLKTEDRIRIVESCRGLSMSDSYWLKKEDEPITFEDINLRTKSLSDAAFEISIEGKILSVSRDILVPDLGTQGMFAKTWHRNKDGAVELWKTDKTDNCLCTKAEIQMSNILDCTGISHVPYLPKFLHGKLLAICENVASDKYSMVTASDFKEWCNHTNRDFLQEVERLSLTDFANMCVADYLFGNADRHMENFAFYMDKDGNLRGMVPLFDHNQALLPDLFGTNVGELFYEPTETTMLEAAAKYYRFTDLKINWNALQEQNLFTFAGTELKIKERIQELEQYIGSLEQGTEEPERI